MNFGTEVYVYKPYMSSKSTMLEVIKNSQNLDWNTYIYFLEKNPLATSECAIITEEELEDMEVENPGYPGNTLGMAHIQDIVNNLKQKHPSPTDAQYMEAFTNYLNKDAFIVS